MSLLGKLKTAIKGNPVLKEYDLGKHVASAGPGLLWKVHNAVKKVNKKEASVFIFYKQAPELEKVPKKDREALFNMLKQGPTHLAKLRHPKILTIDHPVEESSDCIAFATEPVFASLANILGYYDNLPSPLPLDIKEYQLHTIEVHYGLLQIAEALGFLHNDVKMIHGNLILNNVLISRRGDWKLAGFNFSSFLQYQGGGQNTYEFKEWNVSRQLPLAPSLEYLAPEHILSNSCDEHSDMYSYGMLSYTIYNGGKPLFDCHNNTLTYKHNIEQISRISESALGDTPLQLRPLVKTLLAIEPSVRPDALEVSKHSYFEDVLVRGLQYVDTLVEKTDMEKSQWFKNTLGRLITKYPKRVVLQLILPGLAAEFRNHKMIPFVLPLVLIIADDCSVSEYTDLVLPVLIPAFQIYEPIQIPLIFLQKMDLLLKLTSPEQRKQHILPMILGAMEANSNQVQELCVSILPTFADMIDYTSMKHSIIPRITSLCISTSTTSLKIKCLLSLGQMLGSLDKGIVLENILPIVYQIKSREPGVLMGILGIFHKAMTVQSLGFSKEYLSCTALPYLIPLSMETKLNVSQYNQFMLLIKEMIKKVEAEQRTHLEQLSKMEEQTKSTVAFAREVAEAKLEEDSIKAIETFGGGGSPRDVITAKVGSVRPTPYKTESFSGSTTTSNELFSGIDVIKPSPILANKATTSTSNEVKMKIDFSWSGDAPKQKQQQLPLDTWEVPGKTQTNNTSMGMDTSMGMGTGMGMGTSMGMTSNVLKPQASPNLGVTKSSSQTHSGSTSMGTGWSTGVLTPSNSSTNSRTHSGSSSMGTGWSTGVLTPSNSSTNSQTHSSSSMGTGWSTGMLTPSNSSTNSQTHSGSSMGTGWSTGMLTPSNSSTNSQTHSGSSMVTGWSTGMLTPSNGSIDSQTHSSSSGMGMGWSSSNTMQQNNSGTGWSNDLMKPQTDPSMGMNNSGMGMGMLPPSQTNPGMGMNNPGMGMGMLPPSQTNPGMGMNNPGMGMGMLQPNQTNPGMGMNNPGMGMGMLHPNQTNPGMGMNNPGMGMGMLQPNQTNPGMGMNNPGMGMGMLQTNPGMGMNNPGMGMGMLQPAPGANPFADVNSLL